MIKILITGGNGYIAKSLYNAFKDTYDVTSISRNDFDLSSFNSLNKFFRDKYFDVVIHCAVSGGSRLKQETTTDMDANLAMYYNHISFLYILKIIILNSFFKLCNILNIFI